MKMRNKPYLIALSFIFLCAGFSHGQKKTWTLQEAIEHAVENNVQIRQAYLNVLDAQTAKRDAIGGFLPSINMSANHSWNIGLNQNITTGLFEDVTTQFTNASVNVGIDIYRGRQNVLQLLRSNLAILASQYQIEDMKEDVVLYVANGYLQAVFNREALHTEQAQLKLTEVEFKRTQEQVNAGILPEGDLYEMEAVLATQRQEVVVAENQYMMAKISLAQLLLVEDYNQFEIAEEDFSVSGEEILVQTPSELVDKALNHRSDIKLAQTNIEIAQTDLSLAKSVTQPNLTGFYSYSSRISYADRLVQTDDFQLVPLGFVESTNDLVLSPVYDKEIASALPIAEQFKMNDGHNFGLSLNIPILNGFLSKNNIARNKINVERTKFQYKQQVLDLENSINQAYNDTKGARQAFKAAQKTLEARKKAYTYAQNRFEVGAANAFEFSQAKLQFESAQSAWLRAKYDYIFKIKILELYFGIPMNEL
ncbi:MAG: TolC family protein [Flavobacteriaceae bacterium]|nr:TolC family protein [Flavobacteriaceae bacterium]